MKPRHTLPFAVVLVQACGSTDPTGDPTGSLILNSGWYDYTDSDSGLATGVGGGTPTGNVGSYDADSDGYFSNADDAALADCDDTDPAVHPGATEDCANGIDDDCDGLIDGDRSVLNACDELCNGVDDDGDGEVDECWLRPYGSTGEALCMQPECEPTGTGTGTTTATAPGSRRLDWNRLDWARPEPASATRALRRQGSWVTTE